MAEIILSPTTFSIGEEEFRRDVEGEVEMIGEGDYQAIIFVGDNVEEDPCMTADAGRSVAVVGFLDEGFIGIGPPGVHVEEAGRNVEFEVVGEEEEIVLVHFNYSLLEEEDDGESADTEEQHRHHREEEVTSEAELVIFSVVVISPHRKTPC